MHLFTICTGQCIYTQLTDSASAAALWTTLAQCSPSVWRTTLQSAQGQHTQFTSSKQGWGKIGSPVQDRVTLLHCKSATQLQASAFEQKVHHLPRGGAFEQALLPEVNAPLRSSSYDYTGVFGLGLHKSPLSKGGPEQWAITDKEDKSCSLS